MPTGEFADIRTWLMAAWLAVLVAGQFWARAGLRRGRSALVVGTDNLYRRRRGGLVRQDGLAARKEKSAPETRNGSFRLG